MGGGWSCPKLLATKLKPGYKCGEVNLLPKLNHHNSILVKISPSKCLHLKFSINYDNKGDVKLNMIDNAPSKNFPRNILYKKDENPCMKPVILTKTHEYVCNGEVDDVHVGDGLHLLVGQHCHQDQKVSTDSHLKAEICHHIFIFPAMRITRIIWDYSISIRVFLI